MITPDSDEPPGIAAMGDDRVVWTSFSLIAQAIEGVLYDPAEPASEQQRFLLRELLTFLDAEGLVGVADTVIVAGRWAYPTYFETSAYICQPNRSIRPVSHLGFYSNKEIKPEIARVLRRYAQVVITEEDATKYEASGDPLDARLAEVIRWRIADGSEEGSNDIYLLSSPDDDATMILSSPVRHVENRAWTQGQRYANIAQLKQAITTSDLG